MIRSVTEMFPLQDGIERYNKISTYQKFAAIKSRALCDPLAICTPTKSYFSDLQLFQEAWAEYKERTQHSKWVKVWPVTNHTSNDISPIVVEP